MDSSRERVIKAVNSEEADRVPLDLGTMLDAAYEWGVPRSILFGNSSNVPCIEAVDPLAEEGRVFTCGQQGLGQSAVQQAVIEVSLAEWLGTLFPEDRAEVNRLLTPGERIAELASRRQRGLNCNASSFNENRVAVVCFGFLSR